VTTAALILAAGQGTRAGTAAPKQYTMIGGKTLLARSLGVFLEHPAIDLALVVIAEADRALYDEAVVSGHPKLLPPAPGGDRRQRSVLNGLRALKACAPARVLIHDAARPFVTAEIVYRVLDALERAPAAIAAVPLADTLKRAGPDRLIAATLDRAGLWRAQTPQAFRFEAILGAHEAAAAAGRDDITDDAAVAEWAGIPVELVEGSEANVKLTTAEDLAMTAGAAAGAGDVRTGQGFDVHRFTAGDHVWLCGIRLAHTTVEGIPMPTPPCTR
jgi:2-C-methyl-D-erythritol 4-phosphate cytidylyltransferase/2-C-methyl-D-erythritol 2,4-cyclodiphosphate synthase